MTKEKMKKDIYRYILKDRMVCHGCGRRCSKPDITVLPVLPKDATIRLFIPGIVAQSDIRKLQRKSENWNKKSSNRFRSVIWCTATSHECSSHEIGCPYSFEEAFNVVVVEQSRGTKKRARVQKED